jgi:hypothetical protein
MDIQKLNKAVEKNEMNSPLLSICFELEQQGYIVRVEGLEIDSKEIDTDLFSDLENATNEFNIELLQNCKSVQKFKLIFIGYHLFVLDKTESMI